MSWMACSRGPTQHGHRGSRTRPQPRPAVRHSFSRQAWKMGNDFRSALAGKVSQDRRKLCLADEGRRIGRLDPHGFAGLLFRPVERLAAGLEGVDVDAALGPGEEVEALGVEEAADRRGLMSPSRPASSCASRAARAASAMPAFGQPLGMVQWPRPRVVMRRTSGPSAVSTKGSAATCFRGGFIACETESYRGPSFASVSSAPTPTNS